MSRGTRADSADGQAPRSICPPGTPRIDWYAWKSLSQNLSVPAHGRREDELEAPARVGPRRRHRLDDADTGGDADEHATVDRKPSPLAVTETPPRSGSGVSNFHTRRPVVTSIALTEP